MAEENKKKSVFKRTLKVASLIGVSVMTTVVIMRPKETRECCKKVIGFCVGLFKKKDCNPCEAAADLSEATNSEVRSNNNNNGWYNNNRPKFNNKH